MLRWSFRSLALSWNRGQHALADLFSRYRFFRRSFTPHRFFGSIHECSSPPPVPLADGSFCDFRSFPEKPQFTSGVSDVTETHLDVLPVKPIPVAERISQRTRSRTAASQRSNRPSQSVSPPASSSRPAGASTAGSDPSWAATFSLNSPADAGLETTVGIYSPAAPHVNRASNAPDSAIGRPPSSGISPGEFYGRSADPNLIYTRPRAHTAASDENILRFPASIIPPRFDSALCVRVIGPSCVQCS